MDSSSGWWERHVWARQPRPVWLWLVFPATVTYLAVEFAFNSRLLTVVGGLPTPAEVTAMEHWGRSLSGVAVMLAFWPTLLARAGRLVRERRAVTGLLGFVMLSALIFGATYALEDWFLVERPVAQSTGQERHVALNVNLVQQALIRRDTQLAGLNLDDATWAGGDAKAFLSLFPMLSLHMVGLDKAMEHTREGLLATRLRERADPKVWFNHLIDAEVGVREQYAKHYRPGSERYARAIEDIPGQADALWQDYLLRHRPWLEAPYFPQIRLHVRKAGIPVPLDWDPRDGDTFKQAARSHLRRKVEANYARALRDVPPGLSLAQFFQRDAVQNPLRDAVEYPATMTVPWVLAADQTAADRAFDQFLAKDYPRLIQHQLDEAQRPYLAAPAALVDGGAYVQVGADAYRAMWVPPIVLGISLLGALFHLFKVMLYGIQILTGRAFVHGWIKSVALVGLAIGLFVAIGTFTPSPLADQPLVQGLLTQTQGEDTRWVAPRVWVAHTMDLTIHLERFFFPWFERTRMTLGGWHFGVTDPDLTPTAKHEH